ncbi:hypothetical protein [Burkholderia ubonensis]|uniref:hypothetical protein n=1 Tax=Burkholderia ubonensis TaxID=101571 RepID=UPI00076C663B|nr:hypothetical protein [Burkholderia ubonensis]KVP31907.1 hypothetical protein WJ88_09440 [Burkholderia ubonensis]
MTLDDLASPTWWVTTVAAAIALKVAANYVQLGLEKAVSKGTSAWANRSRAAKEQYEQLVADLRVDATLRERQFQREIRLRHKALLSMGFTIVGFVGMVSVRFADKTHPVMINLGSSTQIPDYPVFAAMFALLTTVGMLAIIRNVNKAQYVANALIAAFDGAKTASHISSTAPSLDETN